MQTVAGLMRQRAEELLAEGLVDQVFGWKAGDLPYDPSPAFFTEKEQINELIYDRFCAANLSKYLVKNDKDSAEKSGKTLVFMKPCDTYSLNQLQSEHRADRDKIYIAGVACGGMLDIRKIKEKGVRTIKSMREEGDMQIFETLYGEKSYPRKDILLEKCLSCKGKEHVAFDELIGEAQDELTLEADRFAGVVELEAKTTEERFEFWRGELSRCIRCNACRNVCSACTCIQCVFDNSRSGVSSKASTDDFEDSMFHIIRAYHVAGRCTDCGECSRVCPQEIPLHLLNRKFIKDMNVLYGEYQAGAEAGTVSPLTDYTKEDAEPDIVTMQGGIR